jgi:hypothetical protein
VPDIRLLLFPREEAKILDTWDVVGLSGTGSHDIECATSSCRAGATRLAARRPAARKGPLYAFPVFGLLGVGVAAVGLGVARRAVQELSALACEDAGPQARRLAERALTQARVAEAEQSSAPRAPGWRRRSTRRGVAPRPANPAPRACAARRRPRGAQRARRSSMYDLGGGSSIYRASALSAACDAHVVKQHAMVAEAPQLAGACCSGCPATRPALRRAA